MGCADDDVAVGWRLDFDGFESEHFSNPRSIWMVGFAFRICRFFVKQRFEIVLGFFRYLFMSMVRIGCESIMARLKRYALLLFVILVVPATVVGSFFYLNPQNTFSGKPLSITVGNAQSFECDTLVHIAEIQNFFVKNGLNVTIRDYASGLAAVNDLLQGGVDVAATAEFPLVGKAFNGQNISALGTIAKTQLQDIIGRKDRGIESISDLAGKRVGVTLGTIAEFYFGRFLELNGLNLTDVTIVNVSPLESVNAIVNGIVDAIIIWQPYAYTIENLLGFNAVIWPAQSSQLTYIVEVARNDWITQHPDIVNRFLNSLAQAQDYLVNYPAESEAMVQKNLNYTDAYMAAVWSKNTFSLSLDQSLVVAMENEARWMINNNLTNETFVPNFLNYLYVDGLSSVKPESVNIIR